MGLAGAVTIIFGPIFKEWFANTARPSPGTIKILVYGHSGSGKSTFIENALAYQEARPPETMGFVPYSATINMSFRSVHAPGGGGHVESETVSSYQGESVDVIIADYRGQDPRQIVTRSDPRFFGPPERREVNAMLFFVDFFPAYKHSDSGEMYKDDETIAEVTKGGADQTMALIRDRAKAHSIYLSKFNIGFVFDVALSPGQKNLRSVKLVINKADLLSKIVRSGYLPGVNKGTYPKFEESLFGEIRRNIETTCRHNGVRNFSVLRVTSTDPASAHRSLTKVLAECCGRERSIWNETPSIIGSPGAT